MKATQTLCAMIVASCTLALVSSSLMTGCNSSQRPVAKSDDKSKSATDKPNSADKQKSAETTPAEKSPAEITKTPSDTPAVVEQPVDEKPAPTESPAPGTTPAEKPAMPEKEPAAVPENEPVSEPETTPDKQVASATPGHVADTASVPDANPVIVAGDWPMWGGTSLRNNTPIGKNIPTEWNIGSYNKKTKTWDGQENIKWVAEMGSQSYGNPVIADGRVFVGTNNGAGHLKRYPYDVDLGCLLCFSEKDGSLLWQHSSEKLPTGRVHDWEQQGICATVLAEGKRMWFVSSRGHVICLDAEGFYDGEDDGPVTGEWGRLFDVAKGDEPANDQFAPTLAALKEGKLNDYVREELSRVDMPVPDDVMVAAVEKLPNNWMFTALSGGSQREFHARVEGPKLSFYKVITPDDKTEADTIWDFDMMKTLGTSQHNMCACSVTTLGDILFVNTGNGVDESHKNIPAPDAPSFFAMDKNTGEVFWTDNEPGLNILHGQWSSPTVAKLGGVWQVLFAGGDGWLRSFRADKGESGKPTLLWKFDCNPKESLWVLGGAGTRNNIIATPVVYDGLVYVAVGQDPEHGEGQGHLWCIDPTKRLDGSDVSPQLAMKVEGDKRVPIPHRRLQAVIPADGEVAVDNMDSAVVWHYAQEDTNGNGKIEFEETMHRSCGTVAIKKDEAGNDLLYISDFSGLLHCLNAKTGKPYFTYDMLAQAWGSPLIVENHVYIGDEDGDICIFDLSPDANEPFNEISMDNSVYSTPVVANNTLFIANRSYLFAIQAPQDEAEAIDAKPEEE